MFLINKDSTVGLFYFALVLTLHSFSVLNKNYPQKKRQQQTAGEELLLFSALHVRNLRWEPRWAEDKTGGQDAHFLQSHTQLNELGATFNSCTNEAAAIKAATETEILQTSGVCRDSGRAIEMFAGPEQTSLKDVIVGKTIYFYLQGRGNKKMIKICRIWPNYVLLSSLTHRKSQESDFEQRSLR